MMPIKLEDMLKGGRRKKDRLGRTAQNIIEVDGRKFRSKKEADRWGELKLLQIAGEIRGLELQVNFQLKGADGEVLRYDSGRPARYMADFVYEEAMPGAEDIWTQVVEDTKGYRTEIYRLKRAIMLCMGHNIRET